jgi:hypothetical protein
MKSGEWSGYTFGQKKISTELNFFVIWLGLPDFALLIGINPACLQAGSYQKTF